jgi:asparagine synthase (glutamine-hydrolysing)
MCGIALIFGDIHRSDGDGIREMISAIQHRGPDAQGFWMNDAVAFGHARLSILELSPAGAQPMASRNKRWTIIFNGEIYNHAEIRKLLPGPWNGGSDTESLVEGFSAWGVEETLKKCTGMFALAAWDNDSRVLWLARDRLGEKPIYYGVIGGKFRAASEPKALFAGEARPGLDRNSLGLLLRHNYIPAPYSMWKGVYKLPPGHVLKLAQDDGRMLPQSHAWWELEGLVGQKRSSASDEEIVEEAEALLKQSVHEQMAADVPLGAFLSGGIDSSLVVALMQSNSSKKIRTFTIGFGEKDFDESDNAAAVAKHLGTDHTTMRVTPADAMGVIPELPQVWDEPFSDASQIPTLLLSRLTRKHVTVSLSGDGADELFAGYNRHFLFGRLRTFQAGTPQILRQVLARGMLAIPPGAWDAISWPLRMGCFGARKAVGDKAHKLAGLLSARSADELYRRMVAHWDAPNDIIVDGGEYPAVDNDRSRPVFPDPLSRIQYLDQISYLPDDILVKVDRAGMACGLETRMPFLDHRVVAFSWALRENHKVRNGRGKWILRRVLDRYVPRELMDRPKMGFGLPLGDWLRGPLRPWAEGLLSEFRLRQEGIFRPESIRKKWAEHLSGRRNWHYHLWDILMFQAWHECWQKK